MSTITGGLTETVDELTPSMVEVDAAAARAALADLLQLADVGPGRTVVAAVLAAMVAAGWRPQTIPKSDRLVVDPAPHPDSPALFDECAVRVTLEATRPTPMTIAAIADVGPAADVLRPMDGDGALPSARLDRLARDTAAAASGPAAAGRRHRDRAAAPPRMLPNRGWTGGLFGRRDRCLLVLSQLAHIPYGHLAHLTAGDVTRGRRGRTRPRIPGRGDRRAASR